MPTAALQTSNGREFWKSFRKTKTEKNRCPKSQF